MRIVPKYILTKSCVRRSTKKIKIKITVNRNWNKYVDPLFVFVFSTYGAMVVAVEYDTEESEVRTHKKKTSSVCGTENLFIFDKM